MPKSLIVSRLLEDSFQTLALVPVCLTLIALPERVCCACLNSEEMLKTDLTEMVNCSKLHI